MARQERAAGKAGLAFAVVVLMTVGAIGVVFEVPHYTTVARTSESTAVSTGHVPSVSSVEIANVTIARDPYFYPSNMAVDANTSRIYVLDGTDNVTVVDAQNYTAIGRIVLPGSPSSGMAFDSKSNMIFVSTWGCTNEVNVSNSCETYTVWPNGGIVEIDGNNDTIVGEIPITVDLLTVDPITGVLYGTPDSNSGSNLLAIDGQTGSLIANISLGAYAQSIALDSKTDVVYVSTCKGILGCGGGEVLGINGAALHLVQFVVPLNVNFVTNLVVDAATDTVYILGTQANLTLYSIDGSSGAILYASAIGPCGTGAEVLTINPTFDQLYFVSDSYFVVIDAASGSIVNMLSSSGAQNVVASPNGLYAYLAMEVGSQQFGYLLVIPSAINGSYVNISLLPITGCLP